MSISSRSQPSPAAGPPAHRGRGLKTVGRTFLLLSGVMVAGWAVAIMISWNHIVTSHARLGYLISDLGLAVPLCVAAGLAAVNERPNAGPLTLVCVGALAYDGLHFGVYLIQEQFLGIPTPVYLGLIGLTLLILGVIARRAFASL